MRSCDVGSDAELLTAFCTACAEEKDTAQVLCFQRTMARGEVVGLKDHHRNNTRKEETL